MISGYAMHGRVVDKYKLLVSVQLCETLSFCFEISVMKDTFCEAVNDVNLKRFLKGEMFGCANNLCSAVRCLASNFLLTLVICSYNKHFILAGL